MFREGTQVELQAAASLAQILVYVLTKEITSSEVITLNSLHFSPVVFSQDALMNISLR